MQETGIRQGCPLSPYLFILLMTAMFKDIRKRLNTPKHIEPISGIHFSENLYADDTLIFGTYTPHINAKLREIQNESKCNCLALQLVSTALHAMTKQNK